MLQTTAGSSVSGFESQKINIQHSLTVVYKSLVFSRILQQFWFLLFLLSGQELTSPLTRKEITVSLQNHKNPSFEIISCVDRKTDGKKYCVKVILAFCFQNGTDTVNLYNLVDMAIITFLMCGVWFVVCIYASFDAQCHSLIPLSLKPLYIK